MEQKQQPHRSEAYIALRSKLYEIYYNSYIIERLSMPDDISRVSRANRIRRKRKTLDKKIQALIIKWNQLTKSECGEAYTLKGIKQAACINGGRAICSSNDKECLLSGCKARLSELMPRPKRKRMTAVKVGR